MASFNHNVFRKTILIFFLIVIFLAGMLVVNHFNARATEKGLPDKQSDQESNLSPIKPSIGFTDDINQERKLMAEYRRMVFKWSFDEAEAAKKAEEAKKAAEAAKKAAEKQETKTGIPADPVKKDESKTAAEPAKKENQTAHKPPAPAGSKNPKRTVYLTFDDGPEKFSGDIISLLDHYGAKATFFMLEGNMKKYPNAVKLMVSDGQSVGLHGVSHDKKKFYASAQSVVGEMDEDRITLNKIAGIDTNLIRTPYGSYPGMTPEYKQAVLEKGYKMWDWNIDSMDWYYKDQRYVDSVIAQLAKKSNEKGPLVIIMHERKETLLYLPKLLDYLSSQNYEMKPLNSAMKPVQFKGK